MRSFNEIASKSNADYAFFQTPSLGIPQPVTFFSIGLPYIIYYKNVASSFHQRILPISPMPIWPNSQILFHHGISEHWSTRALLQPHVMPMKIP